MEARCWGSNRCPYVFSSLGQAQMRVIRTSTCQYIQKQNGLCGGKTYELRGSGHTSIDNPWGSWSNSDYGRKIQHQIQRHGQPKR